MRGGWNERIELMVQTNVSLVFSGRNDEEEAEGYNNNNSIVPSCVHGPRDLINYAHESNPGKCSWKLDTYLPELFVHCLHKDRTRSY